MGLFSSKKNIEWRHITEMSHLDEIVEASKSKPQLIYKHSTRCGVCSMVRNRLDSEWSHNGRIDPWHLDLLAHRDISNAIANRFNIRHESPQIIILSNGNAVVHVSHASLGSRDLDQVAA